jgi:hypothetical protein
MIPGMLFDKSPVHVIDKLQLKVVNQLNHPIAFDARFESPGTIVVVIKEHPAVITSATLLPGQGN